MSQFFLIKGRQRSTSLPTTFSGSGSLDIEDLKHLDEFGPLPSLEDVQQNRYKSKQIKCQGNKKYF